MILRVLITIEGIDGAGKSTLAQALAEHLGATLLREPGGVELSERIRGLVADPALHGDPRAIWASWTTDLRGGGRLDSGHHVAEEAPEDLVAALVPFLRM